MLFDVGFNIGDNVLVEDKYKCQITNIFIYDNGVWVEVLPIWENAIHVTREVPISVIRLLEEEN